MTAILVTGADGLIGMALCRALRARGHIVQGMDVREPAAARDHTQGDVRDFQRLREIASRCRGIVHLAAVSRVAWGERDRQLRWAVNVQGAANVIRAALEPASLPVSEDHPRRPMNVRPVQGAGRGIDGPGSRGGARDGDGSRLQRLRQRLRPCRSSGAGRRRRPRCLWPRPYLRLQPSRRYGAWPDRDRRGAGGGGEGPAPDLHLVSGVGTTLGQLATLAKQAGGLRARIKPGPERDYDVSRFVGDPERAHRLLGWATTVSVEDGVRDLVRQFDQLAIRQPPAAMGLEAASRQATVAIRRAVQAQR